MRLFQWVAIVAGGSLLNDLVYISLLSATGLIPAGNWSTAVLRFGIGVYGFVLWLPSILKQGAQMDMIEAGWLSALPLWCVMPLSPLR